LLLARGIPYSGPCVQEIREIPEYFATCPHVLKVPRDSL
jgi:hypothetical protein